MTEHSSIYTPSTPPPRRGEMEPGARTRRSRPQPYANLADEVLETLLHQLRTPLAVMTGWSRMLEQQYAEHADEFLRRGLSQLTRHTSAQSALLARAGDFCDLRAGRATLNRERVDLFDLAGVALRAQQPTAVQRGVQQAATFETPEGTVVGDYARLRQIVADLLAAALEATPVGHRLQVHGAVNAQFVVLSLHDASETPERRVAVGVPEDAHAGRGRAARPSSPDAGARARSGRIARRGADRDARRSRHGSADDAETAALRHENRARGHHAGSHGNGPGERLMEAVDRMRVRTRSAGARSKPADPDRELRKLLRALQAVRDGDFSVRLPSDQTGLYGKVADTFNEIVISNQRLAREIERASQMVGKDGKTRHRITMDRRSGAWGAMENSANVLIDDLLWPVTEVTRTITAVAKGDLSKKVRVEVDGRPLKGDFLRSATIANTMIEQMNVFTSEVTRVAREVGTEGKLGGQALVPGATGTWKDLTDNVNSMAGNLTGQVRSIAEVATAIANGDLSRKITVNVRGEIQQLKEAINTMVDQLRSFASEVTRVAREVGSEGKLGGQALVPGVAGTWKDLTDSVNSMAGNLTAQVRNIAEVATAIARGDLSRKITVDVRGEIRQLKETINTMVDQLNGFAAEVTRVAREVGTEGKLGGQAEVKDVSGVWKDLTDNVNSMASNLTGQVRNISEVTIAVANGDLSRKITVDVRGEILELKEAINKMVDQLRSFASEVTRVAREVGSEGKLGGQAVVPGVVGTWKDLTDSVNAMATNLTSQVRNIAAVTTAVARGDLSRKITVDVKGEILELKETINTMVDQLNAFAAEVTRVAREVGTEGKLGGQAAVPDVAGAWKDLTDNVNSMAGNLTGQVRNISEVATAIANGDLSRKITVDVRGEMLLLKDTLNKMVDQLRSFGSEVTRVAREVGTEGKLGGQANVPGAAGTWKDLTDNVNLMASNLTGQVRNIAEVSTSIARGDLSRKITVDAKGEILQLKEAINTMVDQLNSFAAEVTRVAREVGTEGKLGGQAEVKGVSGVWKDLTDNVNSMASQPDRPGAQHRGRRDRDRERRPVAQDHGRRARRDPPAQGNHQHDGRPVERVCRRSHACRARGRHRGQARRPGRRQGRERRLEGPHRQGQLDGVAT